MFKIGGSFYDAYLQVVIRIIISRLCYQTFILFVETIGYIHYFSSGEQFATIFTTVISFYFGTQYERKSENRISNE